MTFVHDNQTGAKSNRPHFASGPLAAGIVGLLSYVAASLALLPLQWNVVTYHVSSSPDTPHGWISLSFLTLLVLAPLGCLIYSSALSSCRAGATSAMAAFTPLILSAPFAVCATMGVGPLFLASLLHIVGAGWSVSRSLTFAGGRTAEGSTGGPSDKLRSSPMAMLAPLSLAVLITILTIIHTGIQINFFEHLMLGHADMGHFAEELKNALAGRGLRSDSFPNSRLGWHFTPLLYALVPGYWLWPSPVFLMVCSALLVHSAALPIYWIARRTADSRLVAWMFGLAWLLHPSISRLPYSGTYGFQWLYITLPLTIAWLGAGLLNRRVLFYVLMGTLLLCRETTAATTLGFGLVLALFESRRRDGMTVIAISLLYGIACVAFFIPYFAQSGTYERMEVFGALGSSFSDLLMASVKQPAEFWGRIMRSESFMFLAVLLATFAMRPLHTWRISLAAIPALVLILLMANAQWLSIKFWYQVSFLPILFVAAMTESGKVPERDSAVDASRRLKLAARDRAAAAGAVLICCAWGHYLFGFSPLSKSFDLYAADTRLQSPDPTFDAVTKWRREIPRTATILATERLAAHFTDNRRIYTGKRPQPADYVVIDPHDAWDTSGLPSRIGDYDADPAYRVYDAQGSVVVFERHETFRVSPDD